MSGAVETREPTSVAIKRDEEIAAPARRYPSRVVKFLVSLGFWCFSEAGRMLLRLIGRVPPAIATVIYYHQIAPNERQRFARQLDYLCKWAKPIPADWHYPLPSGGRCVAVTFDDGWQSFVDFALPELERRKIPAALFVIPGRLGCRLEPYTDERLISAAELKRLAAKGVIIGSHTLTHCPLTAVDDAKALYELLESRRMLRELIEDEVTLFAFPFGLSDRRAVALCRKAGYRRAFTTQPYRAFSYPEEFETGRINVDPSDWLLEYYLKVVGAYSWLPVAFVVKRRLRRAVDWLMMRTRSSAAMVSLPPTLRGPDQTTLQASDQQEDKLRISAGKLQM